MNSIYVFIINSGGQAFAPVVQWRVPLQGGVIGRAPECDWVLSDSQRIVSRQHAKVELDNAQCFWTDLGTNSTLVNGKPMPARQRVPLNLGDILKIGEYSIAFEHAVSQWGDVHGLMPEPEIDPLDSLLPQAPLELNIDALLAGLGSPVQIDVPGQSEHVPVLAHRMYVGAQQSGAVQPSSPAPLINPLQAEKELRELRHLLRQSVQGYMQLLQARRVFKEETGGNLTTLSSRGNNPLKLARSVDEAMLLLTGPGSPAYLPATQALEQAYQDVLEHMQLSVSQIQTLIERVQTTLNPQAILEEAEQASTFSLGLGAARKARMWDLYCERYRMLSDTWN